jgi:FHA domain
VAFPGSSRERLAQRLNAAYAGGLISHTTLVFRLDEVFHGTLVDSELLVGDLHLREGHRGLHERASQVMTAVASRLGTLFESEPPGRPETLLALDWRGSPHELSIGRSTSCDVVLPDITVSRRHARLIPRDGIWVLHDLSSMNGSYLNGHRVSRCQLRPGDELALGEALLRVD